MSYIKRKPDGEFGFRFFEGSFLHSLLKKTDQSENPVVNNLF